MDDALQKRADELLQVIKNLEVILKKRCQAFEEALNLVHKHMDSGNISLFNPGSRSSKYTLYLRFSEKVFLQRDMNKRGLFLLTSRYRDLLRKYEEVRVKIDAEEHRSVLKPFQSYSPMDHIHAVEEEKYRQQENLYTPVMKDGSSKASTESVNVDGVDLNKENSNENKAEESPPADDDGFFFAG